MESKRLYERVSTDIAAKIEAGEYPIGTRLPSERQLAQSYDVSRPTVREAIIALEVDGMVEVRKGSGVYVTAISHADVDGPSADVGPFELLEARRQIEGEVAALAAGRITDEQLAELRTLVKAMGDAGGDSARAEVADRQFHELIASASLNSAFAAVVESLWDMRARSSLYRLLSSKAHIAGVTPSVAEHEDIVLALEARDPAAARAAMQKHLARALEALLEATEVHEVELARKRVADERSRYAQ